jgi:hypothetical protein
MTSQHQLCGDSLAEANAGCQMVKKGSAIGSLNESQKWYIEKLEHISFQEIGGSQIEPANAAIPVERDMGNRR